MCYWIGKNHCHSQTEPTFWKVQWTAASQRIQKDCDSKCSCIPSWVTGWRSAMLNSQLVGHLGFAVLTTQLITQSWEPKQIIQNRQFQQNQQLLLFVQTMTKAARSDFNMSMSTNVGFYSQYMAIYGHVYPEENKPFAWGVFIGGARRFQKPILKSQNIMLCFHWDSGSRNMTLPN